MSKKPSPPKLVDERLVRALKDPIRAHAMNVLNQRPASPSEIAKELDADVQRVGYHIKELEKLGVIEKIAERNVGGAPANVYRANTKQFLDDEEWAKIPEPERLGGLISVLAWISSDLNHAIVGGTLEGRGNVHISRTPMAVDEEGWTEVAVLLQGSLDELMAIQARATRRIATSGEEPLSTKVAILHFNSPPGREY